MKTFKVEIYISDWFLTTVKAKTKSEAKKKALLRLDTKKLSNFIHRDYPGNRKNINIEEL